MATPTSNPGRTSGRLCALMVPILLAAAGWPLQGKYPIAYRPFVVPVRPDNAA